MRGQALLLLGLLRLRLLLHLHRLLPNRAIARQLLLHLLLLLALLLLLGRLLALLLLLLGQQCCVSLHAGKALPGHLHWHLLLAGLLLLLLLLWHVHHLGLLLLLLLHADWLTHAIHLLLLLLLGLGGLHACLLPHHGTTGTLQSQAGTPHRTMTQSCACMCVGHTKHVSRCWCCKSNHQANKG